MHSKAQERQNMFLSVKGQKVSGRARGVFWHEHCSLKRRWWKDFDHKTSSEPQTRRDLIIDNLLLTSEIAVNNICSDRLPPLSCFYLSVTIVLYNSGHLFGLVVLPQGESEADQTPPRWFCMMDKNLNTRSDWNSCAEPYLSTRCITWGKKFTQEEKAKDAKSGRSS